MGKPVYPGPRARRYAVKELARRAGVSREFFLTWDIHVCTARTTIAFGPDNSKKIHIEHSSEDLFRKFERGEIPVARVKWPENGGNGDHEPDLIIPYCKQDSQTSGQMFQRQNNSETICNFDLLLSLLLVMGRAEEAWCETRDEHGRFPGAESIGARHGYLERPIIDEWSLAFQQEIQALLPAWQPQRSEMRLKLTHDIDQVGIPFQFRSMIAQALSPRTLVASCRKLASTTSKIETTELQLIRQLAAISKARGLHSAFFWKGSPPGPRDSGYDPLHPKIQAVIQTLIQEGFELGVHPGYETFRSREKLASEVNHLRKALGVTRPGGRQHYLRWSPDTWLDWEACGLAYDSSLGFADRIGFRAGTCIPYRPWSLHESRELNLIEIPLIVMDCTPVKYMALPIQEGLERIRSCIRRTARVGGVFTLLWHNVPLMEPVYKGWYEGILDLLAGTPPFELPARSDYFQ